MSTGAALMVVGFAAVVAVLAVVSSSRQHSTDQQGGSLPPLTPAQLRIRDTVRDDVHTLAGSIGGRSFEKPDGLRRAIEYLKGRLNSLGYTVEEQVYDAHGQSFTNLIAMAPGASESAIVIGAHYDTAGGLPGANDNASGCAAVLALAGAFANSHPKLSIRWVFFANEEPPWFQGEFMGSRVYAARCRERSEKIVGMLSLETIGYYTGEPGSQRYPIGLHPRYPDRGDFLGVVSNIKSAPLLLRVVRTFRRNSPLPLQSAALPAGVPGVGWSDHWSFWQFGYPALMLTDTAPYRYPYYHTAQDTHEKLDYDRTTLAITGLEAVVADLAGVRP